MPSPIRTCTSSLSGHSVAASIQDLEGLIDLAQPEQRIAEEREDERRLAFGDERQLPRADRFLIAAAGRIARPEVESRREELRVEPQRFAELGRRGFELALRVQRQAAQE